VLQIGLVEIYAGSLILEVRSRARSDRRGIPALEISEAVSLKTYPGIRQTDRLPLFQERIVLECVIQLLLEHGICLKHERSLIFPVLFPARGTDEGSQAAHTVSLYYDFSGAIDNIYSSLVVRLALSELFGRVRLGKNLAEYEQAGQGVCGLRRVDRTGGWAHLDLLFSEETSADTRDLFTVFVEEHLQREGVTIREVLEMVCGKCQYSFQESLIRDRVSLGHADIICPRCETRLPISEGAKKARETDPAMERKLLALKTGIERAQKEDAEEVRRTLESTEVFFSYAHEDKELRDQLAEHLAALKRQGVIRTWYDRQILPGSEWEAAIDQRLESSRIILLLISSSFLDSDYCYEKEMQRAIERHNSGEARVIPVIVRPCDWQGTPFSKLQALPENARAVTAWPNRDEAFTDIAQGIRKAVEQMLRPVSLREPVLEISPVSEPRKLVEPEPIRILHLSDLHFDKDDDPMVRLQPLGRDLKDREGGLGFDHLDYLVISGDLTNRGSAEEFERVHQFLSELIARFKLSAQRCIIVPGNHDLSWEQAVYDWRPKRKLELSKLKPEGYVEQGTGYLVRDDAKYHLRFENFGKFYHSLTQQPYPPEPNLQCLSYLFDEPRIQFLAFNSAWEIDEFFPDRSSINGSALADGLMRAEQEIEKSRELGRIDKDASVLRIAVWHHPVTGNEKIFKDAFLEQLRQENVKLCLHGHVHEERADVIGYLHLTRKIHIAGAGSFGAGKSARPESMPRLYNVLEVWGAADKAADLER